VRALLQRSRAAAAGAPVDPLEYGFQLTVAHLLDWHTTGDAWPAIAGATDDLRASILNALDPDDYAAIKDAIVDHVAQMAVAREAEKKTLSGTPTSEPISPLPSAAGGVLTGFVGSIPTNMWSS
jgi:hypothetical protein